MNSAETEPTTTSTESDQPTSPEALAQLAQRLRDEQARLIAGWTALENEQRRLATATGPKTAAQASMAPRQVSQTVKRGTSKMGRPQQFRLMRRECDRQRGRPEGE